jgi:hypothetical protein
MSQLHELLAAEKTVAAASAKLAEDLRTKYNKPETYYFGYEKSLKMLEDGAASQAIEAQAAESKPLTAVVYDNTAYFLNAWARTENLLASKNVTNTMALANLEFRGTVVGTNIPVDELLGLETRITELRNLFSGIPTLDQSKSWSKDEATNKFAWVASAENTTKTEKKLVPVVLSPATDKHPAQIEKTTQDQVIGLFTRVVRSGAVTPAQKAAVLATCDELLIAVKAARQRANTVEVTTSTLGDSLRDVFLAALAG